MADLTTLDIPDPWMPRATLLDVTLRDGGFRTGFRWTREEVIAVTRSATAAGAGYVELGYLGGVPDLHNVATAGLTANVPVDLVTEVKDWVPDAELVAMVHPSALDRHPDFIAYHRAGLAMVRLVYHRSWLDALPALVGKARDAGLIVSLNLALASRYDGSELQREVATLALLEPDILYIADTCAGLTPHRIAPLIAAARATGTRAGFHAHDFLSFALTNSIAAAQAGAEFVDGSVWGLGRGAGNLRSELWLAMQAAQGAGPAAIAPLIEALDLIEAKLGVQATPDLASIIAGAFNLTPPQEDFLRDQGPRKFTSLTAAAAAVGDHARGTRTIEEAFRAAL